MLYDAHAHLDLMNEKALQNVLREAKKAEVGKIISCSTSFSSNEKNILLAKRYSQILPAIGLYPLDALELNEDELKKAFEYFEEKIISEKIIGIGEVGLDFKYSTKETEQKKQEVVFERFIKLANNYTFPLIIHSRFAQRQVLDLLEKNNAKKVLLHSYTDSQKLIKKAVSLGYYISAGLNVLSNEETQKHIKAIPLENLLFETDSPIMFNEEKATPKKIAEIIEKVSKITNISPTEIEAQQENNFKKLFEKKF